MTPTELLEEAKGRFIVLYHDDETSLKNLLKQALGKYQEKAGPMGTVKIQEEDEGIIDIPSDFLDIVVAMDKDTRFVESYVSEGKIVIEPEDTNTYPVTVHYFYDLRNWDLDTDLPAGTTSLLLDYLVALIDVPNIERERGVVASTGQQVELPSRQELMEKVSLLEQTMEDTRSLGMAVSVW